MPFFFPSVFHKMVACVIHQEGLWKTSRGKCLKCVRKAEEKDWSGKVFLSSRFFFGSFAGCKITYLKVVVEGWEIMWKTWLTVQRERSFDLCFVTDTKAHLQWQFFSVSMYERELLICLFDLTTCRKCLSEKPEKLVDTGNNGRLVSKRCLLVILKQFFVKCRTFSVISSFLFHCCDWSRKRAPSLSNNQLSVQVAFVLLYFALWLVQKTGATISSNEMEN